ncbi:MAG TPA: serine/threonine-protein kinase [Bacillota bacterium]|nr:serine/threonine-protein kinase [Bacillota bacterium]
MMRNFHRCLGCMAERVGESVCPLCGWNDHTPQESTAFISPGTILNGHYLIGRVLGYGGFGITYLAFDLNLQYKLAIKEYLPQSIATRAQDGLMVSVYSGEARAQYDYGLGKFLDEARMLAKFNNHPCIVSVHDFFKENETAYLVMDFIEGITLKDLLEQKGGKIPFRTTLEIMMPVMDALREVHHTGMLHRDVSPDNIYITKERQIKLLDFGAARLAMGEQSQSLSIILKPGYAPEEQYRSRGKQGPWTDVYAVAATIYRAITGKTPPDSLDRMEEDHLIRPSALGADIPEPQEEALLKAIAVRAADRFNTMAEFQEQLAAGRTQTATEHPVASRIRQPEIPCDIPSSSVNERTLYSQRPAVPVDRPSSHADRLNPPAKSMPTKRQVSRGGRALKIFGVILACAVVGVLGAVTVYSDALGDLKKLFGPKEKAVEASRAKDEPVEITAIATWNHPTKKAFAKFDVKLKKVVYIAYDQPAVRANLADINRIDNPVIA